MSQERFSRFSDFYPYYLAEHSHPLCRAMHYIGSTGVLALLVIAWVSGQWLWLLGVPVMGYGFAWIGHFFIEKNRPATFTCPFYSLAGDWVMYVEFLTGRLKRRLDRTTSTDRTD